MNGKLFDSKNLADAETYYFMGKEKIRTVKLELEITGEKRRKNVDPGNYHL